MKFSLIKRLLATMLLLGTISGSYASDEKIKHPNNNVWTGDWRSNKYKSISGKLAAYIPEEIPQDRNFPVCVDIYYNPESFYKSGKTVRVNFQGIMTDTGMAEGGGKTISDDDINKKLSLKGRPAWSFHVIEYNASINKNGVTITGAYRTKWPSDNGNFTLHLEKLR